MGYRIQNLKNIIQEFQKRSLRELREAISVDMLIRSFPEMIKKTNPRKKHEDSSRVNKEKPKLRNIAVKPQKS